jgi:hypothetical protein
MPLDLTGIDVAGINSLFPQKPKRNPVVAGLSSGIDQLQGLGYNALAAGADALKLERGRDWLLERAARNEAEAYASGRPDLEMVEDQDLSTALPFAAYQIAKQVPQIGAALGIGALTGGAGMVPMGLARGAASLPAVVGGGGLRAGADFAARRAALQAGERFAQNLTGGAVLGAGMGVGDMYGESVEAGDPSPYKAFAASPLYALAEGLPTAVLGNTLARGAFSGGLGTRMAKAGAVNAGAGSLSELAQEELVMGFNPNLTPEEVASRRLNAAVIGGLAEGTFGSLGGLRRPPQPVNLLPGANPGVETQQYPLALVGERGLATGAPPNLGSVPPYIEPTRIDPLAPFQPSLPAPVTPVGSQNYDPNVMYVTPGGTVGPMSALSGLQPDLFGGPDVPYGMGPVATAETPLAPTPDTQTLDMFEQDPTALVRTEYGLQQIRAALRNANGGKANDEFLRYVADFSRAIEQGPDAVDALIEKYSGGYKDANGKKRKSRLTQEVGVVSRQMAQDFQSRMTNAMAARGLNLARPGSVTGAIPQSGATEQQMREGNQARAEQERIAADAARAQAQVIDEQETRAIEAMIQDETDLRAMESQIPERQEKLSPGGQRRLFTNQEMGRVIPNAAPQPEPAVELDQTGQRKLFDSLGRPVTQPKAKKAEPAQKEPQRAVQEPSAAPVSPRKGARGGKPVGEEVPGQGQTAGEGETKPKKPRKAKVKAKVGEQEVELEVDNVDEKITAMRADIDKFKSFVACLRRK